MRFFKSLLSVFISSLTGCIRIRISCKHNILNQDYYQEKTHFLPSLSWAPAAGGGRETKPDQLVFSLRQFLISWGRWHVCPTRYVLWWGHGQKARPWKQGGWTWLPLPTKVRGALIEQVTIQLSHQGCLELFSWEWSHIFPREGKQNVQAWWREVA